jgi:hypothetical protein
MKGISSMGQPAGVVRRSSSGTVSDEELDLVVAQLRRITRTASLEFALRVGAVILHHFYDGDTQAWRSRGPKVASFRRLTEHPHLPFSAGTLYRCVAIYELCDRLNAVKRWECLSVSHLRLVLSLDHKDQERMLGAANDRRWTVNDLRLAMRENRPNRVARGGRRPQPPVTKALRAIQRCLTEHGDSPIHLESLSAHDIAEGLRLVDTAKQSLERLSHSLRSAQTCMSKS